MKSVILLALCALISAEDITIAPYKDNRKCAISYTFDDGLAEHYTLVYPRMEEVGLKGTFFVCGHIISHEAAQLGKQRMTWAQMKEMSDNGHEISNHSWSHPDLTKLTPEGLRIEIERNDSLIFHHTGKHPSTFCYPFNRFNEEVLRVASTGRVGTRTYQTGVGGEYSGSTIESLGQWVKQLLHSGNWGVAMLHGITCGYDAFPSADILWTHFAQVKEQEKDIWVDTFARIATYMKVKESVVLEIERSEKSITIVPRSSLDPVLFKGELTMVVKKGKEEILRITQDNQTLRVNDGDGWVTFDFNPFGGNIKIDTPKRKLGSPPRC